MVLELRPPNGTEFRSLLPVLPTMATYALSFVFIGIYWNNHHHMLRASRGIDGRAMWANLHLLFWLSLLPFVTGWVAENSAASLPTALYGTVLLMAGVAWLLLKNALIRTNGRDSELAIAVGRDRKGTISALVYSAAIALSFVHAWIAEGLYVLVAMMWLVPDPRIERAMAAKRATQSPLARE